jgi:hypothetical protein
MSDNELLDSMFLSLADAFEANKGHAVLVRPSSQEEWEPLREFFARQSAEGLMRYSARNRGVVRSLRKDMQHIGLELRLCVLLEDQKQLTRYHCDDESNRVFQSFHSFRH